MELGYVDGPVGVPKVLPFGQGGYFLAQVADQHQDLLVLVELTEDRHLAEQGEVVADHHQRHLVFQDGRLPRRPVTEAWLEATRLGKEPFRLLLVTHVKTQTGNRVSHTHYYRLFPLSYRWSFCKVMSKASLKAFSCRWSIRWVCSLCTPHSRSWVLMSRSDRRGAILCSS